MVGVSRDAQEASDRFRWSLDLPCGLVGEAEGVILNAFHSEFDIPAHLSEACAALARPED